MTCENGEYRIKGDPLRFIHFSGYGRVAEKCMNDWLPEGPHPFRDLYAAYSEKHEANNADGISKTVWSYQTYESGEKIDDALRAKYRSNYCQIEDDVVIGDGVFIDSGTIIRRNVTLGKGTSIGANCIIGEYLMDFYRDRQPHEHPLTIGENALIRSGTIIYGDCKIGNNFQTGHRVTIREKAMIGDNVSIGTLSDIQGDCRIGNYVRMHSNVHIGQLSTIDDFVWIFPYVVLTNDPTPPSEQLLGVHVCSFAIIATNAIVLPGMTIGQDALIGAGAIVTRDVDAYAVAVGNPAKAISDVRRIKNKITGELAYPWRQHFKRAMPWADSDFDTWFNSLDLNEKEHFGLNNGLAGERS